MNTHRFDTLTRRATDAVSRRRSLLTLAGAAAASSALGPSLVQAGKDAKKAKKRSKKKCKRQVDACRNVFIDLCDTTGECEDEILEGVLACCSHLSDCKAGAALDCFLVTAS